VSGLRREGARRCEADVSGHHQQDVLDWISRPPHEVAQISSPCGCAAIGLCDAPQGPSAHETRGAGGIVSAVARPADQPSCLPLKITAGQESCGNPYCRVRSWSISATDLVHCQALRGAAFPSHAIQDDKLITPHPPNEVIEAMAKVAWRRGRRSACDGRGSIATKRYNSFGL